MSLSENQVIGRNVSLRLRLFVVVYKLGNFGFDMRAISTVPVDQILPPDKLTQASYKL